MKSKPYKKQIGGNHYQNMVMQPSEFINKNGLQFAEGSAIKYICRHAAKGKIQDIHKAIHYLEMIIDRDYTKNKPKTREETWSEGFKKWKKEYENSQI